MSNTNKQNGERWNKVSSSVSLNQWGDVWKCLRLGPCETPGFDTGSRLPVPVHISIHNVHAGAFNHSYISNEIQLQTVINDGVLITANNWPSALRHADTPWNNDPKEARLRRRTSSRSRFNCIGRVQPFHLFVKSVLKYLTGPSLPCQYWKLLACLCSYLFLHWLLSESCKSMAAGGKRSLCVERQTHTDDTSRIRLYKKLEQPFFLFVCLFSLSQQNNDWTLKHINLNRRSRVLLYSRIQEKHLNGGFSFYFRLFFIKSAHLVDGCLAKFVHHNYHVQILQWQP